ncbi:MAG TPA: serine/threonine-protein kinase [Polyangiaceae bacterium]|nr:serine/threonine-protein kinase [Polyangiaceae bacterium]
MTQTILAPGAVVSGANPGEKETLFAERYRIDSVLGTGAMGVVYAATHLELGLPLALKIIHPSLMSSPEARGRFCIEARAGAALRSPHTLRVYDAGLLGSAECYIVMERLDGQNLAELTRARGPLPVPVAVDYVLQACEGLAEAHRIGLVHRDIKPENLFLAQYADSAPVIKVMDFGVARWRGRDPRGSARLTGPRSNVGSPCYQSPEQMQNAADVDERTDVWALGLVLYELLTGECPFESETIAETCWRILQGPRPSLARLRPDVASGLEIVFQRCIALRRQDRYRSMKQLAAALRPFAGARPEVAGRDSWLRLRPAQDVRAVRAPLAPLPIPERRRGRLFPLATAFLLGVGLSAGWHGLRPRWSGVTGHVRHASGAVLAQATSLLASANPAP